MRKVFLVALVVACAALVVAPAAMTKGGSNSANAKLCQKGGYKDWVTDQQAPFQTEQECVS